MKNFTILLLSSLLLISAIANANEFYKKALDYIKVENYTEAIKNLKKALELEPNNTAIKIELANASYIKKAYYEAIPLYTELIEIGGENVDLYKVRICQMQTNTSKAMEVIAMAKTIQLEKLSKANKAIYFETMGNLYFKINYFPDAIEMYKKQLEVAESNTQNINLKLGRSYSKLNSYDKATPFFEKALFTDGETKEPRRYLEVANNYYNAGKLNKAIDYYLEGAKAGVTSDLSYNFNLANMYYEAKDYKNAMVYLNKSKEISPYDQDVQWLAAYTYYNADMTEKARGVIDEMLKINPENADLIYLMGLTYHKDGKTEKAERIFGQAFKINPALEKLRTSTMKF